jgi:hypothetical protein
LRTTLFKIKIGLLLRRYFVIVGAKLFCLNQFSPSIKAFTKTFNFILDVSLLDNYALFINLRVRPRTVVSCGQAHYIMYYQTKVKDAKQQKKRVEFFIVNSLF